MKRMFKKFLLIAVLLITLCGGAIAAYAITCDLICPDCGGKNINHFHPNKDVPCWAFCRDCGHEWYEKNPPQVPPKEDRKEEKNN